jgi:pimeloyl-ACP methyl ester carboxylesterase
MTNLTHNYADVGEVMLHYVVQGEGFPVVLLHGCPQTWYEWRYQIPALAKKYRVIAPDHRGLGDSSRPVTGYDTKTMANDIWQLMVSLGIDNCYMVGHDWGGGTAFSLAAQHPIAVRKLVCLDVAIPGDGADFSQNGRRWHHSLFRTLDLPEALFYGRENLILHWFYDHLGYVPNCINDEDRAEYLRTYVKPGAMRAMFDIYRALPQDNADNQAFIAENGKLRMPVFALGGGKSFGRGMDTFESLLRVAENVRGGLIPDCGHWVTEEKPEYVTQELLTFFAE